MGDVLLEFGGEHLGMILGASLDAVLPECEDGGVSTGATASDPPVVRGRRCGLWFGFEVLAIYLLRYVELELVKGVVIIRLWL
mmetsp:Transcript_30598/g.49066  ORF Transcript_30598/g.49066 Transcript_30598/m.49066 type:complete len:83 (-) Transcript_30598:727-975(-)|eukprot:640138-Amorphochlora_amoeboformis.AAC.1